MPNEQRAEQQSKQYLRDDLPADPIGELATIRQKLEQLRPKLQGAPVSVEEDQALEQRPGGTNSSPAF